MTIGQQIARYRKAQGLSQEALAEAVGVTRQAVSKWELDESQPDAAKIVLLAQALHVTTDQLLLGEDAAPAPPPAGGSEPPPPAQQPDRVAALTRLVKKHGYKAGYFLMGYGLLLLLAAGVMWFMVHSFFTSANSTFSDPFFASYNPYGNFQYAFYVVPLLPAVLGVALLIAGVVIVVKYKNKP